MSTNSPTISRLLRLFLGAVMGFCIHLVAVGGGLAILSGIAIAVRPSTSAEGIFWGFLLALLSSPAGIVTGALTGLASASGQRTWLRMTLIGTIPAVLSGFAALLPFALMGQPNFIFPATVSIAGVLIAAAVARTGSSKRRVE